LPLVIAQHATVGRNRAVVANCRDTVHRPPRRPTSRQQNGRQTSYGAALGGAVVQSYAVLQLVIALCAAIKGLSRKAYSHESLADVIAQPTETAVGYRTRVMKARLQICSRNTVINSSKVDAMAVAHVALTNFNVAVMVLVLMLGYVMVRGDNPVLAQTKIRADTALMRELRGPQGPSGPTGPRGPEGPLRPNAPTHPVIAPRQSR